MATETRMDFDRHAARWDANPGHAARNQAIAEAIRKRVGLRTDMRGLEVGCGTGELALRLAPSLGSLLAVDASGGMVEQMKGKLASLPLRHVDARQLDPLVTPIPGGPYDIVYSAMALHHIDDVAELFRRLAGILPPTGCLAVADLCSEDGSFHGDMVVPHLGFSREELLGIANVAGLSMDSFEEVFTVEKNGRSYPVFLAVMGLRGG